MIEKIKKLVHDKEKMMHYIRYLVVGVLTTVVSWGSFWILRHLVPALEENIANMISIALAIIFAYFTNRNYVFRSTETNKWKEFFKFLLSRLSSFLFEAGGFWLLNTFTPVDEMINKIICSFFVIIINYVISKFFVFKNA
ncbi:MAG: GtrA family protein [Clostridia bacterium]|nr:GtrA family protein [Clostridia bacterium]